MIGGIKTNQNHFTYANALLCIGFIIVLFVLGSCQKDELNDNLPLRTVVVYMIADNNLDYYSTKDINEMEAGFNNDFNGNLIVYVDRAEGSKPSHPVVYQISYDTTETIKSEISFVYNEQNSSNGNIISNVLSDIIDKYPAQSYGLILWSHGTAWYPEGTNLNRVKNTIAGNGSKQQLPLTKSFGRDGTSELNIKELKNSLPVYFEFVIFDACYMGSIEVAYELKDNADYLITSTTEVLSAGYPYQQIMSSLYEPIVDYEKIAKDFFNSYDILSNALKSATVSVIKTSMLQELAIQVSNIMNDTSLTQVDLSETQQYTINKANLLFDLEDFICQLNPNPKKLYDFKRTLNEVVIFKASTPKILDELEIISFSGLSIFIPNTTNSIYYDYYKTLDWYKDSSYYNYFNIFE